MFRKSLIILVAGLFCLPMMSPGQGGGGGGGGQGSGGQGTETTPEATGEQPKASDTSGPVRFWQASVGGGNFMVALDRIVSISRHKYVLDGAFVVDEVTVDTIGQALARFYFITPVSASAQGVSAAGVTRRAQELADQASQRTGTDVQNMVVKKYPETTHAKALEYRLFSEADVSALYSSVKTSWESGRGRQFSVK